MSGWAKKHVSISIILVVKVLNILFLSFILISNLKLTSQILGGLYPFVQSTPILICFGSFLLYISIIVFRKGVLLSFPNMRQTFLYGSIIFLFLRIVFVFQFNVEPSLDMYRVIASGVEIFHFKDIASFYPGGYMNTYLNQVVLMSLMSPLIKTFQFNYIAYQVINAILIQSSIIFISLFIYKISNEQNSKTAFILLNLFIPSYYLAFLIYGDVYALFCLALALFLSKLKIHNAILARTRNLSILVLFMLAYFARTSSIVWILAAIIILMIYKPFKPRYLIQMILLFVITFVPSRLIIESYNHIFNVELGKYSLPTITWIGIGLDRASVDMDTPGMFNSKYITFYIDNYYDPNITSDYIKSEIKKNVQTMITENKVVGFFLRKTVFLWSDPDFESMNYTLPINYDMTMDQLKNDLSIHIGTAGENSKPKTVLGGILVDNFDAIRVIEKIFYILVLLKSLHAGVANFKRNEEEVLYFELLLVGIFMMFQVLEISPRYVLVYMFFLIGYSSLTSKPSDSFKALNELSKDALFQINK